LVGQQVLLPRHRDRSIPLPACGAWTERLPHPPETAALESMRGLLAPGTQSPAWDERQKLSLLVQRGYPVTDHPYAGHRVNTATQRRPELAKGLAIRLAKRPNDQSPSTAINQTVRPIGTARTHQDDSSWTANTVPSHTRSTPTYATVLHTSFRLRVVDRCLTSSCRGVGDGGRANSVDGWLGRIPRRLLQTRPSRRGVSQPRPSRA
jgi:hypothetical protein